MTNFSPSRAGDFAEYYAVTWLWDQGYQVFKNCGCDGPIDLIAIADDGTIIYIDVKTVSYQDSTGAYRSGSKLTDKQKELGVQILGFKPHNRELFFIEHYHETTYTRYRDQQSTQPDLGLCNEG